LSPAEDVDTRIGLLAAARPVAAVRSRERAAGLVLAVVALAMGVFYLLGVRCIGGQTCWRSDPPGYYNHLGRAFAAGQLHLPVQPSAELLALPDPWDPAQNRAHGLHDLVLFDGRYYLYHGAGPAVLLFAPWRLVTGHDLPENVALWALCYGGFLLACGALVGVLRLARVTVSPIALAFMAIALGATQGIPFLLNRIWVYEVAIAGGYFSTSAAAFFLVGGLGATRRRPGWFAAAGAMLGLAVACRADLILVGAFAIGVLGAGSIASRRSAPWRPAWRDVAALATPFLLAGVALAAYNAARFGNPLELGLTYMLAGSRSLQRLGLSGANVLPGLYYFLVSPPRFEPVFPWVDLAIRLPFGARAHGLPADYFLEGIAGALWLAPVVVAPFVLPLTRRIVAADPARRLARGIVWSLVGAAGLVLVFLCTMGWATQRYEIDFLPLLVLAAAIHVAVWMAHARGVAATVAPLVLAVAVVYGVGVNVALGVSGPFDDFLATRPEKYVRLAGWMSPVPAYRPRLDPAVAIDTEVRFARQADGFVEPLLNIGRDVLSIRLAAQHGADRVRLVVAAHSKATWDLAAPYDRPVRVGVRYAPDTREFRLLVDGAVVMRQTLTALVVAPAQSIAGRAWAAPRFSTDHFTGEISVLRKDVGPPA
jgi:hypothetical protein